MLDAIAKSILEPGVNTKLLVAVNVIFFAVILTGVIIMSFINFSIHVLVLTILALALALSINWFVHETNVEKVQSKKES